MTKHNIVSSKMKQSTGKTSINLEFGEKNEHEIVVGSAASSEEVVCFSNSLGLSNMEHASVWVESFTYNPEIDVYKGVVFGADPKPPYRYFNTSCYKSDHINMESVDVSHYVSKDIATVFDDFRNRKAGIIKALTTDYDTFLKRYRRGAGKLYLYGDPNAQWRLSEEVDPNLPKPFELYDEMTDEGEWMFSTGVYCQIWLLAVANSHANRAGLDQIARKILFNLIDDLRTVLDVLDDISRLGKGKADTQEKLAGKRVVKDVRSKVQGKDVRCGGCWGKESGPVGWIQCKKCWHSYHSDCIFMPHEEKMVDTCPLCTSGKKKRINQ